MNLDSSLSKFGDNISKMIRGEKPYYKLFSKQREDESHKTIKNFPTKDKYDTSNISKQESIPEETPSESKLILKDSPKLREELKKEEVKKETEELATTTDTEILEIKDFLHEQSMNSIDYRKFMEFSKDSLSFLSHPIDIFSHNFDANINRFNNSDLIYHNKSGPT